MYYHFLILNASVKCFPVMIYQREKIPNYDDILMKLPFDNRDTWWRWLSIRHSNAYGFVSPRIFFWWLSVPLGGMPVTSILILISLCSEIIWWSIRYIYSRILSYPRIFFKWKLLYHVSFSSCIFHYDWHFLSTCSHKHATR